MVVTTTTSQQIAISTYKKDFSWKKLIQIHQILKTIIFNHHTKLTTLQIFIYKHTIDLKNVKMKKKEKKKENLHDIK
jgi:prolyl-tRNA editing enzyme YbaK/EbsC (Cys-tRNA(Pro) deacylase)